VIVGDREAGCARGNYLLAGYQCREIVPKARANMMMVKAKARARAQGTREGDKDRLKDTCRLSAGEGSGRFMTGRWRSIRDG
jgi:hypothetical protein